VDSVAFHDDGLHRDGAAGDGLWGATWPVPAGERFYFAQVEVHDPADPSTFAMPYAARFTTAGPIVVPDSFPARWHGSDLVVMENTTMHNTGTDAVVPGVAGTLHKLDGDTVIDRTFLAKVAYGDIPPDSLVSSTQWYSLRIGPVPASVETVRFAVRLDISSNDFTYWRDTLSFALPRVPVSVLATDEVPTEFALNQNFPNPFNSTTVLRYEVPVASDVELIVYDLLGREVARLVRERQAPGTYEVRFDAFALSSGFYLCQMKAASFVQTRRMLLIK
jgi:hypothetical protein